MFHVAICDDNTQHRESMAQLLQQYQQAHPDMSMRISSFASGWDLLAAFDRKESFHLFLLDVVMPGISGIELGQELRKKKQFGLIIYLTTSAEFAVESYSVRAFHYLLKPLSPQALFPVLDNAFYVLKSRAAESVLIKTKDTAILMPLDAIIYAELDSRCARYHTIQGTSLLSVSLREPFHKAMLPLLNRNNFILCGASFVINLDYVSAVTKDGAVFKDGNVLALPKTAYGTLKAAWLTYWLEGGQYDNP